METAFLQGLQYDQLSMAGILHWMGLGLEEL